MTSVQLTLIQILVYFAVINSIIICGLLLYFKRNEKTTKWMAFYVISSTLNLLNYTLIPKLYSSIEWFTLVRIPTIYSFGLIIWIYVQHIIHPKFRLSKKHWLFSVPFFLDVLYSFIHAGYIYSFGMEKKPTLFYVHKEFLVHEGLAIFYNIGLFILAFYEIKKHNLRVVNNLSSIGNVNFKWLRSLFLLFLFPCLVWFVLYLVEWHLYPTYLPFESYYPLWCYNIVVSMIIGYRSLLQPRIKYLDIPVDKLQKDKYQNSNFSSDEIMELSELVKQKVEEKSLFLVPNLKLRDLSVEVGIPANKLSQVISEGLETNFYDFINRYRVDIIKSKLATGKANQYDLLGLAYESGFNSKTAFYTSFKKYTGTSPNKYLKSLNN